MAAVVVNATAPQTKLYVTAVGAVRETPQQHPLPLWQNGMCGALYIRNLNMYTLVPP